MSMVSGGRVWTLPGEKVIRSNGKRGMSSYITYMLAVMIPVSLINLSIQCYVNHTTNEARTGANTGGAIGEGYKIVNSVNYLALGGSFALFLALTITSTLFYIVKSDVIDQKIFKKTAALIILAVLILAPILAKNFIVPLQSDSVGNFGEWAKEKYGLSKIESYDSSKTSFDARDASGEKVKMYVYRSPANIVHLYRSEEDLQKILTKNITVNTQNDTE